MFSLPLEFPFSYHVDSHSIFRFVQEETVYEENTTSRLTEVDTQWKMALNDLNDNVTYALSPQAKGKIERPYRWLQDRIVRTCASRENNHY